MSYDGTDSLLRLLMMEKNFSSNLRGCYQHYEAQDLLEGLSGLSDGTACEKEIVRS